jgi:hypothetical protein
VDPIALAIELFWSGPQPIENRLAQRQRHFSFARKHMLCSCGAQPCEIQQVGCPGDHLDVGFNSRACRITSSLFRKSVVGGQEGTFVMKKNP